jgi:hypothetical protein
MGQSSCLDISVTTYQPTTRNVAELLRSSQNSFCNILFISQKTQLYGKNSYDCQIFILYLKKNWAFFISPMHETGNINPYPAKVENKMSS